MTAITISGYGNAGIETEEQAGGLEDFGSYYATSGTYASEDFIGNGKTTNFPLDFNPAGSNISVEFVDYVTVDGVSTETAAAEPSTDYRVSGTTIDFTTPPPAAPSFSIGNGDFFALPNIFIEAQPAAGLPLHPIVSATEIGFLIAADPSGGAPNANTAGAGFVGDGNNGQLYWENFYGNFTETGGLVTGTVTGFAIDSVVGSSGSGSDPTSGYDYWHDSGIAIESATGFSYAIPSSGLSLPTVPLDFAAENFPEVAAGFGASLDGDIEYVSHGNDIFYGAGAQNTFTDVTGTSFGGAYTAYGGSGNDVFIDGSETGGSTFYGGTGDNVYVIASGGDTINQAAGGTNLVIYEGALPYRLPANVQELELVNSGAFGIAGPGATTGYGNSLNDWMSIQANDGFLYGGSGNDTFVALGNGDTLTGGSGTNTAVFGLSPASYSISTANGITTVTAVNGSQTTKLVGIQYIEFDPNLDYDFPHPADSINWSPSGAPPPPSFPETTIPVPSGAGPAAADFYGTGTSSILWQNPAAGAAAIWKMSGGSPTAYTTIGGIPSGWQIAGTGDFTGTGTADILWQNQAAGEAAIWVMNGASAVSYATFAGVPSGWQVAGIGDFTGGGDADILWRNPSTTQIALWEMNGTTPVAETVIGTAPATWKVAGVADFSGDGDAGILWQNTTTGQVAIWEMDGASVLAYNSIATAPSGWTIAGTGDFAGNGSEDILWQNTATKQVAVWQTNGASLTGAAVIANNVPFASGWEIAAVGDYSGTGADSILWQNATTGQAALWQTNGTSLTSAVSFAAGIPSGWQVAHNPVLAA